MFLRKPLSLGSVGDRPNMNFQALRLVRLPYSWIHITACICMDTSQELEMIHQPLTPLSDGV